MISATYRIGSSNCQLKELPPGAERVVTVDLVEKTISATCDATLEQISEAIQVAEDIELANAWPPPFGADRILLD